MRTYSILISSDAGEKVVEIFSNGVIDYVEKPHPNYPQFAGPRGEHTSMVKFIPWSDTWLSTLSQQLRFAEACRIRRETKLETPPISKHSAVSLLTIRKRQRITGRVRASAAYDCYAAEETCDEILEEIDEEFEHELADDDCDNGERADLESALRAMNPLMSDSEIQEEAARIVASRAGAR